MNTKFSYVSLAVALVLGVSIWLARPAGAPGTASVEKFSDASGTLAAEEYAYDFGRIPMSKGVVSHEFRIRNSSSAPLALKELFTSCMCTEAALVLGDRTYGPFGMPGHGFAERLNASLGAGESAVLLVSFDPNAHGPAGIGPITRFARLETASGGALEVTITGQVTP